MNSCNIGTRDKGLGTSSLHITHYALRIAHFALLIAILLASSVVHAEPKAINFVYGVDWTGRVITVTGEGFAPQNTFNYTQARRMALMAARMDGYRKLGEIVNGVHVDGQTTIGKMRKTHRKIQTRISATIKGAQTVSEDFFNDGSSRVIMQLPLFGSPHSLAGAIFEKSSTVEPFPIPVQNVSSSRSRLSQPTIVLGTSEPVKKSVSEPIKKSVEEFAKLAKGIYTGLIVDCRGLGLKPVMSPVILNTNGTKIFGHKNIDVDKIVSMGMVDYVKDPNAVSRAGDNPLIVKPVKLENFNSNPVLSLKDSNRVLVENYVTKFLKELKVVFLFD